MSRVPEGWRLFLIFALASLATRGPFLGFDILNVDEAAHAVGSWELMDGGRLYVDFADHKPPLIYAYYALAQLLMGRDMLAVRLMTTLLVLPLTALAASAFYGHGRRGAAAGLLYILYGAAFLASEVQAVNGEVLMLCPAAWALVAVRSRERAARLAPSFAAGLLLGVAALVKPQAAFWAAAVALVVFRAAAGRRRWVLLAALLSGVATPLLATVAWFAKAGTLDAFLYWNVTHNLAYAANPIGPAEVALRAARFLLPLVAVTAPLWWGAWRARHALEGHARLLVAGALAASLPAVFLGWRFFPHYFIQLYLPLALAAAPYAAALAAPPRGRRFRALLAWTVLVVAGFTAANLVVLRRPDATDSARPVFAYVTSRLRADPCFAGARLFVWGFAPDFYYHARLRPASRFVIPGPTLSGYQPGHPDPRAGEGLIRDDHWRLLIDDLQRHRATYVLDTAGAGLHRWRQFPAHRFPQLWALLRRDYTLLDTVDGVAIHRLASAPCASPPPVSPSLSP
jgi:4-amino-4-deoxy-L-arabinose transferase-like glycosyltransferase